MAPYSMDWIAFFMSWDIIKINPVTIHTGTPSLRVGVTLEVEAMEGKQCSIG
jgi:hypothetical protein